MFKFYVQIYLTIRNIFCEYKLHSEFLKLLKDFVTMTNYSLKLDFDEKKLSWNNSIEVVRTYGGGIHVLCIPRVSIDSKS